jgi:hypothetical protein
MFEVARNESKRSLTVAKIMSAKDRATRRLYLELQKNVRRSVAPAPKTLSRTLALYRQRWQRALRRRRFSRIDRFARCLG